MNRSRKSTSVRWKRDDGLEFDRVPTFTDAVFAIALTLLVLDLHLPTLHHPHSSSDFLHALGHIVPDLIAFGIAFSVVGQNWIRQHRYFAGVGAIDGRYLAYTVVYLGCIALVPFPTGVISRYTENPMAFTFFAVVLSMVAAADALLISHTHSAELMREPRDRAESQTEVREALSPIILFLGTIPLAFLISPIVTLILWLPLSFVLRRALKLNPAPNRDLTAPKRPRPRPASPRDEPEET